MSRARGWQRWSAWVLAGVALSFFGHGCGDPDGTKGLVLCGSSAHLCDLEKYQCCTPDGGEAKCILATKSCEGNLLACDDSADCADGQACCEGSKVGSSRCQDDCQDAYGSKAKQPCASDDECQQGNCRSFECDGLPRKLCDGYVNAGCTRR